MLHADGTFESLAIWACCWHRNHCHCGWLLLILLHGLSVLRCLSLDILPVRRENGEELHLSLLSRQMAAGRKLVGSHDCRGMFAHTAVVLRRHFRLDHLLLIELVEDGTQLSLEHVL